VNWNNWSPRRHLGGVCIEKHQIVQVPVNLWLDQKHFVQELVRKFWLW